MVVSTIVSQQGVVEAGGFSVWSLLFFPVSTWVLSGYFGFLSQSIDMHLLQLPSDQCVIKWRDGWMSARLMWSSCFLCVSKGITNPLEGGRFQKYLHLIFNVCTWCVVWLFMKIINAHNNTNFLNSPQLDG